MKPINMMKRKNAVKERILSLEETNIILTERLELYENERKRFKENKILNLINLLCKKLDNEMKCSFDFSYKEDIECLELLFKILNDKYV